MTDFVEFYFQNMNSFLNFINSANNSKKIIKPQEKNYILLKSDIFILPYKLVVVHQDQ